MSLFGGGQAQSQPAQSGGFNVGSSPFGGSAFGSGGMFSTPQAGAQSVNGAFGAGTGFGGSMFGNTTPAFGAPASTPSIFGSPMLGSTPAFGQTGALPAFGQSASFGQSSPSIFGQTTPSLFGQTQQAPSQSPPSIFGQTSAFGQTQPSLFGQPQVQQAASPSSSIYGQVPGFGQTQPSLFGQPQAQASPFGQSFGQTPASMFGAPQQQMFQTPQLTTQMAPVAPVIVPLPDREVQAFIDAYKEEPGNPKYAFKHLLLSVTDPSARVKPVGVSDIMWAEAINKLEGMDSVDRERLWPEVVYGFKDLSKRLKLQDEAIAADVQRLQATEANVKLLHRHFDTDTLPWIQRLRQKEQELQRRLLKVMRIVEALEGKGFRMALTRGETKLGEQLRSLTRQLRGSAAEIPRRVDTLLSRSRMLAGVGQGSAMLLLGPGKIDEQSLSSMQEVLRQQTEAISHLTGVLKRDIRDLDIIVSENVDMVVDGDSNPRGFMRDIIVDGSKLGSAFKKHPNRLV